VRPEVGELAARLEALGDDLVQRLAAEHALAAGVVGGVEAAQHLFEVLVERDGDAEHLAADPAVEALHHAVRVGRVGPGMPVFRVEFGAGLGEGRGEAAAVVGQHVGEPEGEGRRGLAVGPRHCLGRRRPAMALRSVSSSLTARWTERERRSMAT
jgi:hypothetical protein